MCKGMIALEAAKEGRFPCEPLVEGGRKEVALRRVEEGLEETSDGDEEEDGGEDEEGSPGRGVGDGIGEVHEELRGVGKGDVEVLEDVAELGDDEDHEAGEDKEEGGDDDDKVEAVEMGVVLRRGGASVPGAVEEAGDGGLQLSDGFFLPDEGGGGGRKFGKCGLEGGGDGVAAGEPDAEGVEPELGFAVFAFLGGIEKLIQREVEPDGVFKIAEDNQRATFTADGEIAVDDENEKECERGSEEDADEGENESADEGDRGGGDDADGCPDEEEHGEAKAWGMRGMVRGRRRWSERFEGRFHCVSERRT